VCVRACVHYNILFYILCIIYITISRPRAMETVYIFPVAIISIVHRFDPETASPPSSDADTAQKTHPRACRAGSSGPITNGQTTLRVCSPARAAAPMDRFTGPLLWRQTKPYLSGSTGWRGGSAHPQTEFKWNWYNRIRSKWDVESEIQRIEWERGKGMNETGEWGI